MQVLPFLAHGAWGIWDEVLPALLIVGFVIIFIATAVISRLRDSSQPNDNKKPADNEQPNPSTADHYRLD